ncbi:hypothetical protein [Dysgonomonas sp. 25]|uniref:hypothetical protein n=1 Tax=Dysgonomonas sp. 25 TaxID=2302933 RepID=UPI0013D780A1|nr:hypothetical protein [Dysgonomonas sp. 25]
MKKILMVIAIAAMSVSFVACGGSTANSGEGTTETTETTESSSSSSSNALAEYEKICNKMIELGPKIKAGDASAIQEYTKISEEYAKYAQDHAEDFAKLTPEEAQKLAELGQKVAQAMQ